MNQGTDHALQKRENMNAKSNTPSAGEKKPEEKPDNRTPAQREDAARWAAVRGLVKATVPAIKIALPVGSPTDPERFAQLCLTVFKKDWNDNLESEGVSKRDKALIWCSDYSLQRCMVQAAELDLQPGSSLGQCFFIRYGWDCTFQIGVWGYVALMHRGEQVVDVWADVIYEKDEYVIERGARRTLRHKIDPLMPRADRGRVLGAYACVEYSNEHVAWEFVNFEDLEMARSTSKAKNSPAYASWPDEMRKRTALKRLAKYVEKCLAANLAADRDESDELREDLAEALKTITVQGETIKETSKQAAALLSIMTPPGGPVLPPHVAGQSAREQLEGLESQTQGAEVSR